MTTQQNNSLSLLSFADLEALILKIVQKVLIEQRSNFVQNKLEVPTAKIDSPPQSLLETFGSWEDDRTPEEIIDELYTSRTIPTGKYSL